MSAARTLAGLVILGTTLVPLAAQAALSKAAGGSGYSGTLSNKPAVRQQQLICDPPEPIRGSTSVLYEADKVSLSGFAYGPGYGPLNGLDGVVEVQIGRETKLQSIFSFLADPQGDETGYAQVYYQLDGQAGQIIPGGPVLDEDPGPGLPGEGVDTHQFFFDERIFRAPVEPQGIFPVVVATYIIYADEGNRPSGNRQDFLTGRNDAGEFFTLTPAQLERAIVTAPEPSALAVVGLGAVGLLRRGRRAAR